MINHTATALLDRHGRGWLAQITYPKGDRAHVEILRTGDGTRFFPSQALALAAAAVALCEALNRAEAARSGTARIYRVSHGGGRARLVADADRPFRGERA